MWRAKLVTPFATTDGRVCCDSGRWKLEIGNGCVLGVLFCCSSVDSFSWVLLVADKYIIHRLSCKIKKVAARRFNYNQG